VIVQSGAPSLSGRWAGPPTTSTPPRSCLATRGVTAASVVR